MCLILLSFNAHAVDYGVLDCDDAVATTFCIINADAVFDGSSDCGGACDKNDTIYIEGGARSNLTLQNFDGVDGYITITNDPVDRVLMEKYLIIDDCSYISLEGDNLGGTTYGIKITNSTEQTATVWVQGESDHIKISYLELTHEGSTGSNGNGIFIQDGSLPKTVIWDTFEIHHNYIHDTRYSGMYLGQNEPGGDNNDPYIANVSVHDNIFEDIGAYGMTLKGIHSTSGPCSIYDNTIKTTGLVFGSAIGEKEQGISISDFYGSTYVNIYGNWVENTPGPGIRVTAFSAQTNAHQIYNNILIKNGTDNDDSAMKFGNAILLYFFADGVDIFDNIIIEPTRYGIYARDNSQAVTDERNLIGDAVLGERYDDSGGNMTEGTGVDANIEHADVADFYFNTWSDDADFSNDDFGFTITNGLPIGEQACTDDPKNVSITWNTPSRKHNCRIDTSDVGDYDSASAASVSSTDAMFHEDIESLACGGGSLDRFVYCEDDFGAEIGATQITFSIDAAGQGDDPPSASMRGGGASGGSM